MSQPSDPHCIFCKIVAGQIPCHKVHEDELTLAFLDVFPLARGHLLLIPKAHYPTLELLPPELAGATAAIFPRLGKALVAATGAAGWNLLQNNGQAAGQVVHHVHFHFIPRVAGDSLGYRWPAGKLDSAETPVLVAALRAAM